MILEIYNYIKPVVATTNTKNIQYVLYENRYTYIYIML